MGTRNWWDAIPTEIAREVTAREWVVGSDECGYGSWAGPLTVCAVVVARDFNPTGVGDSKKLTEKQREAAFDRYTKATPATYHLVWVSAEDIDRVGVWKALLGAHREALENVIGRVKGTKTVIVDGFPHGTQAIGVQNAIGLPKADMLIPAVGLASIIAKVSRDRLMQQLDQQYPGYGFGAHKGYGVPAHQRALREKGPCDIHRKSYAPIKNAGTGQDDPLFIID